MSRIGAAADALVVPAFIVVGVELAFAALSQWPPAVSNPDIAGAVAGAAGTVLAGWIAWIAVQRQISAEADRHAADQRAHQVAVVDTLTTAVLSLGVRMNKAPERVPAMGPVNMIERLLYDVMRIDTRLGAALSQCILEFQEAEIAMRVAAFPEHPADARKDPRYPAIQAKGKEVAFRCAVLAAALEIASHSIAGRKAIPRPIVTQDGVRRLTARYGVSEEAQNWASFTTDP